MSGAAPKVRPLSDFIPDPCGTPPDPASPESTPPEYLFGRLVAKGKTRMLRQPAMLEPHSGNALNQHVSFTYTTVPGDSLISLGIWSGRPWQDIYQMNRETLENSGYTWHSRTDKHPETPMAPGTTLRF